MARIFITGSSDGIGQAAARILCDQGHRVTLHARNAQRAAQTKEAVPKAENVLIGDLSSIAETKKLAEEARKAGPWDSIVHNAGLGPRASHGKSTDGIANIFAVNTLAPYILTSLMEKPKRVLYMSSGMHFSGDDSLKDAAGSGKREPSYSDTKLHDVMLASAVARLWPDVKSVSMDPGWVKTKMGSSSAPGDVSKPAKMLAAWAAGESDLSEQSGIYFGPSGKASPQPSTSSKEKQDQLLKICEDLSGVSMPT